MKKTSLEIEKAIEQINKLFLEADSIWSRIPGDEQNRLNEVHNEEGSLGHCIRWGITACEELSQIEVDQANGELADATLESLEEQYIDAATELRDRQAELGNYGDEVHKFVAIRDALKDHPEFSGRLPKTYFSGSDLDPDGCDELSSCVNDGLHIGPVVYLNDGIVGQKINRAGDVVQHDVSKLSLAVKVGDNVEITYKNGIGDVHYGIGKSKDVGR